MRSLLPITFALASLAACSPAAPAPAPVDGPAPVPSTPSSVEPTAAPAASAEPPPPAPPSDVELANAFAVKLFSKAAQAPGNLFVSPPSVRLALAAVYPGAAGTTRDELAAGLSLDRDPARALAAAKTELASWNAPRPDTDLTFATRLWVDASAPIGEAYAKDVGAAFGAGLEAVDFKGKPEPSRALVNAWVKTSTKEKIPEILPAGSVTPLTRLVVTNAVYFKGRWVAPFDGKDTKAGDFVLADGKKKAVPTMHKVAKYPYVEQDGLEFAALPYEGSALRMVVVLPPPGKAIADAEKALSAESIARVSAALSGSSVRLDVALPRFELRWGGSVTAILKALGIERVFTDAAELDAIGKELRITDVFHKTFISVDEKGTEAAASTGVVIGVKSMPAPPKPFVVDHPFLFFIEDASSGRVLFVGRVMDPTAR